MPAYNAEADIETCLRALQASSVTPAQLIVVDDGSTDRTREIARSLGVTVIDSGRRQSGPGAARNVAAQHSNADLLLFVDADVVVCPDTLARLCAPFEDNARLGAVFGSYDDKPGDPGFLSQYKNLQHHYVHQAANPEAETFWAGCGAVRRTAFEQVGGFDGGRYGAPSIEDIELGYRLREHGWRIRLERDIQVCHLKRWRLKRLLHTEIFCRALPWSALMLARGKVPADLNLHWSDRFSAVAAWLLVATLAWSLLHPGALAIAALALLGIVLTNRGFYGFLWRRRGTWFALRSVPLHVLYFLYSSACFGLCWFRRLIGHGLSGEVPS